MPAVPNQINLQTSFSKLSVLYYLLKVVKDNEPTTRTQTRNTLFPIARSKLKSTTTPWDPSKADTHARITLEEYGLIEYDSSDDEKFSVSKLGNDFLSSFNLILNPAPGGLVDPEISLIADQDEATYLIWRILCATRIVDGTYDIHPYRILMALLLRQELKGRITKREWAHFLVNTNYSRDEKLDFIESSLKCFRTSAVLQDIKSTDRVLGRLKDWNVIVPVSGTTGDAMAYTMKDSFKWVAYSNLTKKELAMNDKDIDIIKKLFEDWAQTQPSLRGGNITLPVAQHYSYELEKDVEDPLFSAIPYSNLFQITDNSLFATVKSSIENTSGFSNFDNGRGNGYFSRALKLYESFLRDPVAHGKVQEMLKAFPYLTAIRTKPFILLAGISGTGKSRIVRQLARGCCPETKDGQPHPLRDEQKPGNFELIPVRPNWHDSTELMGYVTRITGSGKPKYELTPFVKFLVKAWLHKDVPFFLCLDEMNLAPVEQYFAEYLSKIETRKLSGGEVVTDVLVEFTDEVCGSAIEELLKPYKPAAGSPIPPEVTALENAMKADKGIRIPPNLVVMGTVNMDETTCSFSRKVLDRAMSFELNDVEDMYTISTEDDPKVGWGAFNNGVVNRAKQTYVTAENLYAETDAAKKAANMAVGGKVLEYLKAVNVVLDKTPFKVAYRTRNEMMLYCVERGGDLAKALDEVTSMKILSRIEGDENAVRVTNKLVESAAVVPTPLPNDAPKNLIQLLKRVILKQLGVVDGTIANAAAAPSSQEYDALEDKYKICTAKLDEMNDRLLSGYTGFWR